MDAAEDHVKASPLYLYVQHACTVCDQAQLELDAADVAYVRFYVTAGVNPDQAIVWNPDGSQELVPRAHFEQGFPMLVDREHGIAYIGLPGIIHRAELEDRQRRALDVAFNP